MKLSEIETALAGAEYGSTAVAGASTRLESSGPHEVVGLSIRDEEKVGAVDE